MSAKPAASFVELTPRQMELSKPLTGRDHVVKVAPVGWTYPRAMKKYVEDYANFEVSLFTTRPSKLAYSSQFPARFVLASLRNAQRLAGIR